MVDEASLVSCGEEQHSMRSLPDFLVVQFGVEHGTEPYTTGTLLWQAHAYSIEALPQSSTACIQDGNIPSCPAVQV